MFPHVDIEVVFPFGDISTLGTHVVLVLRVSEHVFREVGLISTPEVTQATFVGLLATVHQHVSHEATFMSSDVAALRTAVGFLTGV